MLKLVAFMRALEYTRANDSPELRLYDLQGKIGQEPHQMPNVFSYFQPDYAAPGHIKAASIKSPEAQVLTAPKVTRFLNGKQIVIDAFVCRHLFRTFVIIHHELCSQVCFL